MAFPKSVLAAALFSLFIFQNVQAQFVVPDPALVTKFQFFVPDAMNGNVLDTTHADVLNLAVLPICCAGITDLSGVEFFTGLVELRANNNSVVNINELPPNLEDLDLRLNQLTSLPPLPNTLEDLDCSVNAITSLPTLPASLKELNCTSNQIGSLPALPQALNSLYCSINPLTSLPSLPASLTRLGCVANSLTVLPTLPPALFSMDCSSNDLTSLPAFPTTLHYVVCGNNDLSVLPALSPGMVSLDCRSNPSLVVTTIPASLRVFWCDDINITALPPLPNGLESLSCKELGLTALPTLPDSLRTLYCEHNQLAALPTLPQFLDRFHCDNNQLTVLPNIPSTMVQMTCTNNDLTCLPALPNVLYRLKCTGNSLSCLPNMPLNLDLAWSELGFPLELCNVNTAPCPIMQEVVTGKVFNDANGNGVLDAGELPFTNAVVEGTPGNYLTAPASNGEYVLPITNGTFTVDGRDVLYHTRTTAPANITLGVLQIDSLNDIGYQAIPGVYDLVVEFYASAARPGFDNNLHVQVRNVGTEATTASIDLLFDIDQNWVNSTEVPATLTPSEANWSPVMQPGDVWNATITMNTPVGTALGTALDLSFTATPAATDTTPANNSITRSDVVVGSFDPNDKTAYPAAMTPLQVQNGAFIEYTIRFQNTGTYPAERVVITDTLSNDLLWNTMEYRSASHANTWYINDGVLHFIFDPIFLPDSVSDEPNSHGFVKFVIKPVSTLLNGAQIENIANIYFDFNEPVITDPALFEVDESLGMEVLEGIGFRIYPNPASDQLIIELPNSEGLISIHSIDGRKVLEQQVAGSQTALEVSGLVDGMYLISFTQRDGKRVTQRFVKR